MPDITAAAPVFIAWREAVLLFGEPARITRMWRMSPGSMPLAREIYQEGLRIPPVLIQCGGKIDRELLGLVLANVRTPVEREGDLMAQLMSILRGEASAMELVAKYGEAAVVRNMRGLQDYSERMMRANAARASQGLNLSLRRCFEGERGGEFSSGAGGGDAGGRHGGGRFQRVGGASRWTGPERESGGDDGGDDVCVPLPGARGDPVYVWHRAARFGSWLPEGSIVNAALPGGAYVRRAMWRHRSGSRM